MHFASHEIICDKEEFIKKAIELGHDSSLIDTYVDDGFDNGDTIENNMIKLTAFIEAGKISSFEDLVRQLFIIPFNADSKVVFAFTHENDITGNMTQEFKEKVLKIVEQETETIRDNEVTKCDHYLELVGTVEGAMDSLNSLLRGDIKNRKEQDAVKDIQRIVKERL